jgi:hypothetical protein
LNCVIPDTADLAINHKGVGLWGYLPFEKESQANMKDTDCCGSVVLSLP